MHHKHPTTAIEVIDALGGYKAVCNLTSSAYKSVHRWGQVNHFPSRFYLDMARALERVGVTAPAHLWRQGQNLVSQTENTQHTAA